MSRSLPTCPLQAVATRHRPRVAVVVAAVAVAAVVAAGWWRCCCCCARSHRCCCLTCNQWEFLKLIKWLV